MKHPSFRSFKDQKALYMVCEVLLPLPVVMFTNNDLVSVSTFNEQALKTQPQIIVF